VKIDVDVTNLADFAVQPRDPRGWHWRQKGDNGPLLNTGDV